MLYFFIDKKKFKLPESLNEITLAKYKQVSEFYELHKPQEDDTEKDIISYYMDFISLFIGCSKDELKRVRITSDEGFGITELYSYLLKFLDVPDFENFEPCLEFKHNGVKYKCIEENLEVLKTQKPLENMTFEEYEDATTILQNFDALKYEKQDALSLLASVLFRPLEKKWYQFSERIQAYDSDKAKERAEVFQDIDMHKIYSAYFFLTEQTNTLLKDFQTYTEKGKVNLESLLAGIQAKKQ